MVRFQQNPFTDRLDIAGMGAGTEIDFISGNSGGQVGPDAGNNIFLLGDNATGLNIIGVPATSTLTVYGLASSTTQVGTSRFATNAEAAAQTLTTVGLTPSNITSFFSTHPLPASQGGTGVASPAANSLLVTNGSSPFTVLGVAANGALPIGSVGAAPVLNTITAGAGVAIVNGPGTITISAGAGVPTTFTANSGTATPALNNLNILGATVAAGTSPLVTAGAGSTITINAQRSQALAAADATKVGLSNFDSASFSVDANGFVSLLGGGEAIDSIAVQATTAPGVSPVVPTAAGLVTINGTAVAAQTIPIQSRSIAVNSLQIEAQRASASASTNSTQQGLASFDSAAFTVDANGWVQLAGGGLAIDSIQPDSGTNPVVPTGAGLVSIVGSGSTTTVGSLNTLTVQLTGLTNHAVLVGAGTTTITKVGPTATAGQVLQSAGAAADPAFSTATYPSTTTVSQILYSSATNTVSGLATANQGVLTTGTTGIPVITAMATNGALIIGSTAGAPASATLSAGAGISITNGSNSITIAATGGGFTWTDVTTATQTLAVQNGYVTDRAGGVTYTLPATASLGDCIKIVGKSGIAVVTPNANQQILIGSVSGTVGATGTATANNVGDCLELICITAGASTVWRSAATMGTWTLA